LKPEKELEKLYKEGKISKEEYEKTKREMEEDEKICRKKGLTTIEEGKKIILGALKSRVLRRERWARMTPEEREKERRVSEYLRERARERHRQERELISKLSPEELKDRKRLWGFIRACKQVFYTHYFNSAEQRKKFVEDSNKELIKLYESLPRRLQDPSKVKHLLLPEYWEYYARKIKNYKETGVLASLRCSCIGKKTNEGESREQKNQ